MISRCFFFSLILLPLLIVAKIPDTQIPHNIKRYFEMNRLGPELISAEIINHHQSGRTLKIKIIARRSMSGKDLIFAFAAAAAVANFAEKPIELLWVDMDVNFKGSETTMAIAPANCTIDAIILKNCETEKWWQDCLQFP